IYENDLKPFVSTLYKYPHIQAVLHYSGVVLYWLERSHPELFMLIEDMVSRRQIELLGGGFYEPMLPLLSQQDKIGQIELFTTYLRKHFGKRPLGCWIPAFAWEQNLVSPLSACGMGYTFLSEGQFLKSGISGDELYSPCLTEDQGKLMTVFPVFHSLEKDLAEKNAQAVFKKLYEKLPGNSAEQPSVRNAKESAPSFYMRDAGITISVFPGKIFSAANEAPDYAWNRFFEELSLSESIVECVNPSKIFKGLANIRKAVFPDSTGGYAESPRSFLISYPEAGGIYSKMVFVNLLINQLRGDKARKLNAREELWKAQGYNLFSSVDRLYRPGLRKAAYRALVGAERITREKTKFVPSLLQLDFDFDGANEFLFQEQKINCYIRTMGAGVFELDYLPRSWNYVDTCNNYNEKEGPGASASRRRLASFTDTFFPAKTEYKDIIGNTAPGKRCCAHECYAVKDSGRNPGKAVFSLEPELPALPGENKKSKSPGDKRASVPAPSLNRIGIEKTYSLTKDTLTVAYALTNHDGNKLSFLFVPDIELSFPCADQGHVRLFKCKTGAKDTALTEQVTRDAECIKIQDIKNETQITLTCADHFDFCFKRRQFPVDGADVYQSSAFLPVFTITLDSGKTWNTELSLKFSN
ncbi:MAG: DUF1926 domain-containing protein, partial [Treponema sp.]|nr:DUF1926 domain-containing protein [Treponema sp.]